MSKLIAMTAVKIVTPKARAEHELMFSEPDSEPALLIRSSSLAAALG
jgi:hypothetical protein